MENFPWNDLFCTVVLVVLIVAVFSPIRIVIQRSNKDGE